jgi:hypothetical protein
MNMVIVLEIVLGILLLAAAVRFAVRDVRQRRSDSLQQQSEPEHAPDPGHTPEEHAGEHQAQPQPSGVADRV